MQLEALLRARADLWRAGDDEARPGGTHLPSGNPELDRRLGGGWPLRALSEILLDRHGIGELRLLLPALAELSRTRWLAWVAPPHIPYAPALAAAGIDLAHLLWIQPQNPADGLWAAEQALRSGVCGAVLHWPDAVNTRQLRRLQLAAEHGEAAAILFRPRREAQQASPAALRIELEPQPGGHLTVHVRKRRGGWTPAPLELAVG